MLFLSCSHSKKYEERESKKLENPKFRVRGVGYGDNSHIFLEKTVAMVDPVEASAMVVAPIRVMDERVENRIL